MRIPGRKIWRAFRELDEFSDEQCRRFVKRAWGGWVPRVLASVLVIGTFVATLIAVGWVMVWVYKTLDLDNRKNFSDFQITAMAAVVVVIVAAAAPMTALLARDFFLRALIWRVLNIGGVCSGCNYPLYGLPLSETMACSCPECGAVTNVDSALVELVRNESGQTVAQRKQGGDTKYFWSARKLKIAGRTFLWTFVVLFVLPVAALALNELIVRLEAARATARLSNAETLSKVIGRPTVLVDISQRNPVAGAMKADTEMQKLYNRVSGDVAVRLNVYQTVVATDSPTSWEFQPRARALQSDATQADREKHEVDLQRENWRRGILRAMEGEELRSGMQTVGESDPTAEPLPIMGASYGAQILPDYLWGLEFTGRLAIERMRIAAEEGDRTKFEESLRAALAVNRWAAAMPIYSRWWAAVHREVFLWKALREAIGMRPDWAGEARAIIESMPLEPDQVRMFEVERLIARDRLLNVLANPDMVRFNRYSPELVRSVGGGGNLTPGRIGWVSENIAMNDRRYDEMKAQLEAPPWNRPSIPATPSDLLLAPTVAAPFNWLLAILDYSLANRAGMRVWLAIEEFRATKGRLPVNLQELDLPREALLDPLSGKPWGYLVQIDEKTKKAIRPEGDFLLYSLSIDGMDDFARTGDPTIFVTGKVNWAIPALMGRDVLINSELK